MAPIPNFILWGSTFAAGTGFLYIIKSMNQGTLYEGKEKLTNKVVIITGANTGIGKEVAHDFAKREATVVMACRDLYKCEKAREQIVFDTKNKFVYCRQCDLASQKSIRDFVNLFKKEHSKLHILINNAGVMRCPKTLTTEGIEMQLGVNHFGHFLLTNLLLDTLKSSTPARIVTLSSLAHMRGKINVRDLNSEEYYSPGVAYAQSKLANILFTVKLSKELRGTGVTANAVHPGIVDTEITRHLTFFNSKLGSIFLRPFIWPFVKYPKYGAQQVIYAALSPELNDISGEYLSDFGIAERHSITDKTKLQEWLWDTSIEWTKLKENQV